MYRNHAIVFLLVFSGIVVLGQDLHFSQYYASPLHLNPGMTGVFDFDFKDKDIRATSIFRQQWRTIKGPFYDDPKPFNTFIASIDGLVKRHKSLDGNFIGLGMLLYQDNAGDLNYKTQYSAFSASYGISLNREHTSYFTAGGMAAIGQNSVDFSKGFFDNQWTGTEFDPTAPTGENFPQNNYTYYDYSFGMALSSFPFKRNKHTVGVSMFHVNKPDQNFYSDNVSTLNMKYVAHYEGQYPLKHHRALIPIGFFHTQAKVYEFSAGGLMKFVLQNQAHQDVKNLQFGLAYRMVGHYDRVTASDALVILTRMRYRDFLFGFSYDSNFSGLTPATRTVGAFEVSIVYYADLYKRSRQPRRKPRDYEPVCPDE